MKNLYAAALTLVAVFSFSALAVTPAPADEWLVKGATFTGELNVEITVTSKLILLAGGFLEPESIVECTSIFDGAIVGGASGEANITKALNHSGEEVTKAKPLSCKGVKTCEKPSEGEDTLLDWLSFLWKYKLVLMSGGIFSMWLLKGPSIFEILCLVLGASHKVLCEGETGASFELSPSLLEVFNARELEEEHLEELCEEGGANHENVVLQEGTGTIKLEGSSEEIGVSSGTEEA